MYWDTSRAHYHCNMQADKWQACKRHQPVITMLHNTTQVHMHMCMSGISKPVY